MSFGLPSGYPKVAARDIPIKPPSGNTTGALITMPNIMPILNPIKSPSRALRYQSISYPDAIKIGSQ